MESEGSENEVVEEKHGNACGPADYLGWSEHVEAALSDFMSEDGRTMSVPSRFVSDLLAADKMAFLEGLLRGMKKVGMRPIRHSATSSDGEDDGIESNIAALSKILIESGLLRLSEEERFAMAVMDCSVDLAPYAEGRIGWLLSGIANASKMITFPTELEKRAYGGLKRAIAALNEYQSVERMNLTKSDPIAIKHIVTLSDEILNKLVASGRGVSMAESRYDFRSDLDLASLVESLEGVLDGRKDWLLVEGANGGGGRRTIRKWLPLWH